MTFYSVLTFFFFVQCSRRVFLYTVAQALGLCRPVFRWWGEVSTLMLGPIITGHVHINYYNQAICIFPWALGLISIPQITGIFIYYLYLLLQSITSITCYNHNKLFHANLKYLTFYYFYITKHDLFFTTYFYKNYILFQ